MNAVKETPNTALMAVEDGSRLAPLESPNLSGSEFSPSSSFDFRPAPILGFATYGELPMGVVVTDFLRVTEAPRLPIDYEAKTTTSVTLAGRINRDQRIEVGPNQRIRLTESAKVDSHDGVVVLLDDTNVRLSGKFLLDGRTVQFDEFPAIAPKGSALAPAPFLELVHGGLQTKEAKAA